MFIPGLVLLLFLFYLLQVRDRDLDIAKLHTQLENSKSHASARNPEIMKDEYTIVNLRAAMVSLEESNQNLRTQLQGCSSIKQLSKKFHSR